MEIACAVWLDLGCHVAGSVCRVAGFGVPCGGAAGAVWPDVGVACVASCAVWLVDFGRWQQICLQSGLTLLPRGRHYCHVAIDLRVMSAEWRALTIARWLSFWGHVCRMGMAGEFFRSVVSIVHMPVEETILI